MHGGNDFLIEYCFDLFRLHYTRIQQNEIDNALNAQALVLVAYQKHVVLLHGTKDGFYLAADPYYLVTHPRDRHRNLTVNIPKEDIGNWMGYTLSSLWRV